MTFQKLGLSSFLLLCSLTLAQAQIRINEILHNPPGTDNGQEFYELQGPANASLNGLTFLVLEGDASVTGIIKQAISLNGQSIGSNGLFLHRDGTQILLPAPDAGTSVYVADFAPDIENGYNTFALVSGFTGAVGQDIDADNDGILDIQPWTTLLDAVGMPGNPSLNGFLYGTSLGAVDIPVSSFVPMFAARVNSTWVMGTLTTPGTTGPYTVNPNAWDQTGTVFQYNALCPATLTPGTANPTGGITAAETIANACDGQNNGSVSLAVSGAVAPYTYLWDNGATNAAISGLAPDTFNVTITDANGCTSTEQYIVDTLASPSISVTAPGSVCVGSSAALSVSGAVSYIWSNGSTMSSINPTVNTASTFTVTGTDANGCSASASANVGVNLNPTIAISGTNAICAGGSTSLTVSGTAAFLWSEGSTTATISVSPASTTTYTVSATGANGCTSTSSSTVTVNQLPAVSISGNSNLCAGASTTLTATGGDTYVWSNGDNTASITVTPSSSSTYTVTATSASGCTATNTQNVVVNALPTPTISGNLAVCQGGSTTLTASGNGSFVWSNGQTNASITVSPTSPSTFSVTATGSNGCTASTSANLTILNGATSTTDAVICQNDTYLFGGNTYSDAGTYNLTLTAANGCDSVATLNLTVNALPSATIVLNGNDLSTSTTYASYQWYFNGVEINGATNQTYTPTQNGNYSVEVLEASTACTGISADFNVTFIGTDAVQAQTFRLFPNPSRGQLNIQSTESLNRVDIYNIEGQLLQSVSGNNITEFTLDGAAGVYTLRLFAQNGQVQVAKVVKVD